MHWSRQKDRCILTSDPNNSGDSFRKRLTTSSSESISLLKEKPLIVKVFDMKSERDELRNSEETFLFTGTTLKTGCFHDRLRWWHRASISFNLRVRRIVSCFTTVLDDAIGLQVFVFRLTCGCVVVKHRVARCNCKIVLSGLVLCLRQFSNMKMLHDETFYIPFSTQNSLDVSYYTRQ